MMLVGKKVAWFKKAWGNFQKFQAKADARVAGVKAIVKRSIFHHVAVQQLVQMFILTGWAITQQIIVWCSERWKILLQTQICEDGFNREKKEAKSKQNNKVGRELLAYQTLIESDVVQIHKYHEVEQRAEHIARGEQIDKTWITSTIGDMSISTRGVVGYNPTPKWQSISRSNLHQGHADLQFMVHIADKDDSQSVKYA